MRSGNPGLQSGIKLQTNGTRNLTILRLGEARVTRQADFQAVDVQRRTYLANDLLSFVTGGSTGALRQTQTFF